MESKGGNMVTIRDRCDLKSEYKWSSNNDGAYIIFVVDEDNNDLIAPFYINDDKYDISTQVKEEIKHADIMDQEFYVYYIWSRVTLNINYEYLYCYSDNEYISIKVWTKRNGR